MPSSTPKQARTMAAAAHNPAFAKKVGIPQGVAKDFNKADKAAHTPYHSKSEMGRSEDAHANEHGGAFFDAAHNPRSSGMHKHEDHHTKKHGTTLHKALGVGESDGKGMHTHEDKHANEHQHVLHKALVSKVVDSVLRRSGSRGGAAIGGGSGAGGGAGG